MSDRPYWHFLQSLKMSHNHSFSMQNNPPGTGEALSRSRVSVRLLLPGNGDGNADNDNVYMTIIGDGHVRSLQEVFHSRHRGYLLWITGIYL